MRTWRLLKQSTTALGRNKTRSFLVMLGVSIGIAALTVVVGMAQGANKIVMRQVQTFGPTTIMLFAGGGRNEPGADPTVVTLTLDDAQAVETQIPGIRMVCVQAMRPRVLVSYRDQASEVTVGGASGNFQESWEWYVEEGEFFTEQDLNGMARVAVAGQTVASTLFQGVSPIGETIRINNANFTVTGLLSSKGSSAGGGDMDDRIIIPITTAMRRTFNTVGLTNVRITAMKADDVQRVANEVRALIRERHMIQPPELDDFRVVTPDVIAGLSQLVAGTLNKVLLAVTILSLVVGGIVLMNLMLLSVTDRRHEIGLRRALGGRQRDVLLQFLFESLLLTISGGLIGLVAGAGAALVVRSWSVQPIVLSWEPVAVALALSVLVGLVFGLLPARRAAGLHPVEALR
ncbi:MAG: ABC transporter permease [Bryobacteraceae bacterium]|nr:ABC transporter permease [Bryobacteraceae bacterium]